MKTQENLKQTHASDDDRDFDLEFSFAFGYKQLHQMPLFVYADELFDGGMIKPLKVYKHSDPLLPKGKHDKSSKISSQRKDRADNIREDARERMDKSSLSSRSWSPSSNKKWKLKDLLLFRSVSEGHGSTRDNHGGKCQETVTFSQVKSVGEGRRKQGISAHERHYRSKMRAGEEMKRKTFLPYKKTLLMGCSDLDPGVYEFCKGHAVEIKC